MGRYNSITRTVIRDIYNVLKVRYGIIDTDCYNELNIEVGDYEDEKSGLEFYVTLQLEIDSDKYEDNILIDGCVFTEEEYFPTMILKIGLGHYSNLYLLSKLYPELRDIVRHEIEHLTQRGINRKEGKYVRGNNKIREKVSKDELPQYRYFILKDEVTANIQGLYSKAKALKEPFQIVIDKYLDNLVEREIIQKENRQRIYKTWKKRIPKIGGIPQLK